MGGGGKGGKETTQVRLPPEIEKAAKENLRIADEVAAIGYMPYQGPTVAALAPQQYAAMQNTGQAAQAFGMAAPTAQPQGKGGANIDPFTGLPMPQQFAGGLMGYSPYATYQQQVGNIAPAQRAFVDSFVVNPMSGAAPVNPSVPRPQYDPYIPGMETAPVARPTTAPVRQPTAWERQGYASERDWRMDQAK